MTIYPIFLDGKAEYLADAGEDISLLRIPLGTGNVLRHLHAMVAKTATGDPAVLPTFEVASGYAESLSEAASGIEGLSIITRLDELLDRCEPSDWLLLIDAAHLRPREYPTDVLKDALRDPRCVTHLLATDQGSERAEERVTLDSQGHVRRIQRYYAGVTSVGPHAVFCSMVSGAAARGAEITHIESLGALRKALAAQQIPSRDVVLEGGTIDVTHEHGLLSLSEELIRESASHNEKQSGLNGADNGVIVGSDCRIHPTARLFGPLILQDNVRVEARATVIGPALLGFGARVQQNATVAHSLLAARVTVPAGATVYRRVLSNSCTKPPRRKPSEIRRRMNLLRFAENAPGTASATRGFPALHALFKRVAETLVALVVLITLLPLFALAAIIIKLESRGPVFFSDPREGKDGRIFRCWKFRTMSADAQNRQRALYKDSLVDGPQFKLKQDPRITRFGHWLRITNIDELPQLINILLGEMSLIGPRPSPFRENQICVAWRQARLSVRPGITGLWQVCRHERSAGDFHQWIYYDTLYVRHLSYWLDLKILLATVLTCGGRWNVPISWILPNPRIRADQFTLVPTRMPILGKDASSRSPFNLTSKTSETTCPSA